MKDKSTNFNIGISSAKDWLSFSMTEKYLKAFKILKAIWKFVSLIARVIFKHISKIFNGVFTIFLVQKV